MIRGSTTLFLAASFLTSCAGDNGPAPGGSVVTSASQAPTEDAGDPVGAKEWVAVFRTAEDSDELDADTDELLRLVPDNLIVGPAGCHGGLAERLDVTGSTYFSGVVADSRQELDSAIDRAGRSERFSSDPILVGEFVLLCGT